MIEYRGNKKVRFNFGGFIMGQFESFNVTIPYTGLKRLITVYLPPGYEKSNTSYPVMYMHDNQNLFDTDRSTYGDIWKVDQAIDAIVSEGFMEGIIVVGIDNPASDNEEGVVGRLDEYSPWVNSDIQHMLLENRITRDVGGYGQQYAQFLVEDLKPMIDEKYRTLPDRFNTAVAGSSMGGLISLYIGLEYEEVFSKIGAFSTAVWFAEKELLALIQDHAPDLPMKWYLDIGTKETSNDDVDDFNEIYIKGTMEVYESLLKVGVKEENIKLVVDEGAVHNEKFWANRFPAALKWLYNI